MFTLTGRRVYLRCLCSRTRSIGGELHEGKLYKGYALYDMNGYVIGSLTKRLGWDSGHFRELSNVEALCLGLKKFSALP